MQLFPPEAASTYQLLDVCICSNGIFNFSAAD